MNQYSYEEPFDSFKEARELAPSLAFLLRAYLRDEGRKRFTPPPLPSPQLSSEWTGEAYGCRLLVAWVPDWSPARFAGKFVARVDTLTK